MKTRFGGGLGVWLALVGVTGAEVAAQTTAPTAQLMPAQPEPPPPEPVEASGTSEVRVSEYMTVDIVAQNDALRNVLHKLAVQARRNIVPSPRSDRIVNATIYDVPFYGALEGLLRPNGLGYIEQGDFIYVYTEAELAALGLDQWSTVTRVLHLDYIRPEDARDFVSHLLSEQGEIEVTKDLEVEAEQAGGQVALGGLQAGQEEAGEKVYTPNVDEFALSNAIVVHDYPENVDRIEAFLHEIDTQPAQVLIEASIVQTTLTEENAFGVDFAILSGINFTSFLNFPVGDIPLGIKVETDVDDGTGQRNIAKPSNFNGFAISDPGNTGQGDATFRGGYINDDFGVFIRALDRVTDVTLLSNPKVLTLNRQRARIHVGERVGYLETQITENQVTQTVQFIDTGVILDIRPYILRDGRVRLELAPKVSDVEFRIFEASSGQFQEIPNEQIETVNANVLVPEGYSAVIGGLFREDSMRSRQQVPVLGDLPVAGPVFRGHDDEIMQVEIIFLIKPTVLEDKVVAEMGRRGDEWAEYVRVGARDGLLPWSRERQSAKLNLQAERLMADGKYGKALWKLRRSLELYPLQPQVLAMRRRLMGGTGWWPARTYLDRVITRAIDEPEALPQ